MHMCVSFPALWHGLAWHGFAWNGPAWHGPAWSLNMHLYHALFLSFLIFLYHFDQLTHTHTNTHTSVISGTASGRTDTMNSRDVLPEVKKTDPIVG